MKKKTLLFVLLIFILSCSDINIDSEDLTKLEINTTNNQLNSGIGFTAISPSDDSLLIYISNSEGNDSNDGLSPETPVKTLDEGLGKMREGYPDHVYLKRGDVWTGVSFRRKLVSGRSVNEPAVLAFYGATGDRPVIESNTSLYTDDKYFLKNFHFIGLEFSAYQKDVNDPDFTGAGSVSFYILGGGENLLFEDILFNHSELLFQSWDIDDDGIKENSSNITIRRNIFTGNYVATSSYEDNKKPSNLYAQGVEGYLLIEENVFDYGGWHPDVTNAGANQFNHNIYLQYGMYNTNITLRNNIIVRGSSHGVHGRSGGLFEDNFFARNAVSLQLGYHQDGVVLPPGRIAYAFNNVITEGETMVKGNNPCSVSGLCTGALWGLNISKYDNTSAGDVQVKNNIVTRHGTFLEPYNGNTSNVSINNPEWYTFSDVVNVDFENNIVYEWGGDTYPEFYDYNDPGRILEDYSEHLGHAKDFDTFMDIVKGRSIQEWNSNYEAMSINEYIRDGFKSQTLGTDDF